MKRFLSVMLCVVLVGSCSLTSQAFSGSVTANLTTDISEAYSSKRGCHTVCYSAHNDRDSIGSVYVAAQLSTGNGWVDYKGVKLPAGSDIKAESIGSENETYLCRGVISTVSGRTGCSGQIKVDIMS